MIEQINEDEVVAKIKQLGYVVSVRGTIKTKDGAVLRCRGCMKPIKASNFGGAAHVGVVSSFFCRSAKCIEKWTEIYQEAERAQAQNMISLLDRFNQLFGDRK